MIGGAVLILLAVAAAGLALAWLFRQQLDAKYDDELMLQLDSLTAVVGIDPAGRPTLRTLPADPRFHEAYGGRYWQISAEGAPPLRSRSLWDITLPEPTEALPAGELGRREIEVAGLGPLRLLERVSRFSDRPGTAIRISVGLPVAELVAATRQFERLLWLTLGTLAAALVIASAVQVTVGLAPLAGLERALARIRSGAARRMEGGFPLEVVGLVDELNGLLAARERSVERARAQAADLAHALKTPLQLLLLDAERLQHDRPDDAAMVRNQAHRMQAVVERHLSRARTQGRLRTGGAWSELAPCAEEVARILVPVARSRGLDIQCRVADGLRCPGDRADLEEILGSLVENACKWARSQVRVSGRQADASVTITVEDDGPGLPEVAHDRAVARGQRLDETMPGSGLGLAIAREVVEGLGGWLRLEPSEMGGLAVKVQFPVAPGIRSD
ncbi:MAG: HAMP domain-containing sensor histidine kinase [Geminicoccaceae bacterium]